MAHWHGLAKLRMHSDLTLEILDQQTTDLGEKFCQFKTKVCAAYYTQELSREADARSRRQSKAAAKRAETSKTDVMGRGTAAGHSRMNAVGNGKEKASLGQSQDAPKQPRRVKSFRFQTYKFHALGDYVSSIRRFGTTDSYSTEPVGYDLLLFPVFTQILTGRIGTSYIQRQILSY